MNQNETFILDVNRVALKGCEVKKFTSLFEFLELVCCILP